MLRIIAAAFIEIKNLFCDRKRFLVIFKNYSLFKQEI
jgi:hypothetical protein